VMRIRLQQRDTRRARRERGRRGIVAEGGAAVAGTGQANGTVTMTAMTVKMTGRGVRGGPVARASADGTRLYLYVCMCRAREMRPR